MFLNSNALGRIAIVLDRYYVLTCQLWTWGQRFDFSISLNLSYRIRQFFKYRWNYWNILCTWNTTLTIFKFGYLDNFIGHTREVTKRVVTTIPSHIWFLNLLLSRCHTVQFPRLWFVHNLLPAHAFHLSLNHSPYTNIIM